VNSVNLILFSASYPCVRGGEANFLDVEVKHLLMSFDRVVVVPEKCDGDLINGHVGLDVDESYARLLKSRKPLSIFLHGLLSPLLYRGLLEKNYPRFFLKAWRRLIAFAGKAEITRKWVVGWLQRQGLDGADCLFYTYWFDQAAAGIGLAKRQFPGLRIVSRAHGYDIYEEQYYNPPFWPCRWSVLPLMNGIFPDSQAGTEYLRDRYPEHTSLFEMSLLGVADPGFMNYASDDGVFRLVSCSMIRPEKRVELMLESVRLAAIQRPGQCFEWHHVGNGPSRGELQKVADATFPPNARAFLPGYSDNHALMKMYKEKPFDAFINLSKTEGTPVSIMEAISCGIPIIATAVGGNKEVVSMQNGILLTEDPTSSEVASAIFSMIDNPSDANNKRNWSRKIWQAQYNADVNFSKFAKKLRLIRSGP